MASSNSQITSQTQDSPTCDAWAVVSFENVLGTVNPKIAINEGAGIETPQRISLGASNKVGYRLSFSDPARFSSGAYVVLTTPQVTDDGQLAYWNISHGYTGESWSGTPAYGPGLNDLKSGFVLFGVTLSWDGYGLQDTGNDPSPLFAASVCEGKPNYQANVAVFSLSTDSDRGVTTGKLSVATEGGFGKNTDNQTSVSQNLGFFDEKKRVASAYGTVVIPPRKGATSVIAYMEDAFNTHKTGDGYLNGISAGGVCSIDVAFTEPLDNSNYCVILSRETMGYPYAGDYGSVPTTQPNHNGMFRNMRIPYIRGTKTREGFRIEVAAPDLFYDPNATENNGTPYSSADAYKKLRRITYGVTSDFYSSGYGEKIHFMVFGGTEERIARLYSTDSAWTTNPNSGRLTTAYGPADYEVYGVAWTDPDYGRDGSRAGSSYLYTTVTQRDTDATKYAGFYTAAGGATYANAFEYSRFVYTQDPLNPDPGLPSFSDVNVNYDAATTGGLNAIQAGIRSIVPLFVPYLSGSNVQTPNTVTGLGSVNNNVDPYFGITFCTDLMIYRTLDRMKTVPVGKRHIYPRFIGNVTPSQGLYESHEPYTVLQHYKQMDGVTWSGGVDGITSAGYRVPSKTKPHVLFSSNLDWTNPVYSYMKGPTAYTGVLISASFPAGATGITLTAPSGGLTLFHNDSLWFSSGAGSGNTLEILVGVPAYNRLGVFTASAGESKRIPVQGDTVTVSGTVGGGYSSCNIERSILISGGTFPRGRTLAPIFTDNASAFAGNALKNYLDRVEAGVIRDRPVGQDFLANARFEYIDDDCENINGYSLYYSGQDSGVTWGGGSNQQHRTYLHDLAFNPVQPNRKAVSLFDDCGIPAGLCGMVNYKDPEFFMGTINDPRIRTYKFEFNGVTNDGSPTVASMFMDIYNQLCANFGTYYRGVICPGMSTRALSPAYPEPVSGVPAAITLDDIGGVTYQVYNAYNALPNVYGLGERKKYPRSSLNYIGGSTRTDHDPGGDPKRDTLYNTTRINGADRGAFSPYNLSMSYPSLTWTYILRALCEGHYRSLIHNKAKNRSWGVITCGNYLQTGPVKPSEMLFNTGGNSEPSIHPVLPEDVTCSPNFYAGVGVTAASRSANPASMCCYFPNPGNDYRKKYLFGGVPYPASAARRVAVTTPETSSVNYGGSLNAYDYVAEDGTVRFYHRLGLRHGSNPDWFGGIRSSSFFGVTAGSPTFVRGATVSHSFSAGATAITAWVCGITMRPGDYVWFGRFGGTVFNYITGGNVGTGNQISVRFHDPIGFTGSTGDSFLVESAHNNAGFVGFMTQFRALRAYQNSDPKLWKHFAPWVSSPRLGPSTWGFNMDRRYWWELMYHLILAGAHRLIQWCDGVEFEAGDRRDHDLIYIHTVLNNWRNISGNSKCAEPLVTDYPVLADKTFISGARIASGPNAGLYIWRITVRPGLLDETVTLTQNTRADLPPTLTIPGGVASVHPHGTRGVWLITRSAVKPEYTIAAPSADAFDSIAEAKDQYYPWINFFTDTGIATNDPGGVTWANWTGTSVALFQGVPESASESRAYPWNANPTDLTNTPWHNLVYERVIDAYKWGARSFHLYLPYGGYIRDSLLPTYGASGGAYLLSYQHWKDAYTVPSPAGLTHQQPARWKGFPQAINALLTGTMTPPNSLKQPINEPCNVYLYLPGVMGWSDYRRKACNFWKSLPGTTAEKDAAFYAKLDAHVETIKSMKPSNPIGKGKLSVNLDVGSLAATPESVHLYRTVGDPTAPSAALSGAYLTDALELSDWYVKRKLEAAGIPVFIESRPSNRINQALIAPTEQGISGAAGQTASTGWQGEFVTSDEPWFWGSTNPQNFPDAIKRSEIRHWHRMDHQGFRLSDIYVPGASSDPFGVYHTVARGNTFLNMWRSVSSLGAGGYTADGDRTQYTPMAAVGHLYALSDHYRHYTNLKNGNTALKGVCYANYNMITFVLEEFKKGGQRVVELQNSNQTKYARYNDIHPSAWPVWKTTDVFNGASFEADPRGYATNHQTKFWTEAGKGFWQNNVMTTNFSDFVTMLATFSATAAPAFATAQGWAGATYPFDYYSRNTIGAALGLSLGGTNEVN